MQLIWAIEKILKANGGRHTVVRPLQKWLNHEGFTQGTNSGHKVELRIRAGGFPSRWITVYLVYLISVRSRRHLQASPRDLPAALASRVMGQSIHLTSQILWAGAIGNHFLLFLFDVQVVANCSKRRPCFWTRRCWKRFEPPANPQSVASVHQEKVLQFKSRKPMSIRIKITTFWSEQQRSTLSWLRINSVQIATKSTTEHKMPPKPHYQVSAQRKPGKSAWIFWHAWSLEKWNLEIRENTDNIQNIEGTLLFCWSAKIVYRRYKYYAVNNEILASASKHITKPILPQHDSS